MLYTILALLFRVVSNPLANLFQKKLTAENSSICVNFYTSLFLALFSLLFLPKINFLSYGFEFYFYVILSGFLCFLGTLCLIKALSIGEMSVLGPVNSYKSVIGLIFAFLFLGETPSLKGIIGFLIIIFASFFFTDENGHFILNKSVLLRLLALVFTGVEAVILKKIILLSSPLAALIFWCVAGLIFGFICALFCNKIKPKGGGSRFYYLCAVIAILLFIMQFSTNIVFEKLDVGLSLALFQLSNVISLIFGFKIFKEKGVLKKSIGTCLMLFGSWFILV